MRIQDTIQAMIASKKSCLKMMIAFCEEHKYTHTATYLGECSRRYVYGDRKPSGRQNHKQSQKGFSERPRCGLILESEAPKGR